MIKEGYEELSENIFITAKQKPIYRTLKKIPMGTLQVRLSQRARVFVNGKFYKECNANELTDIPLRANRIQKLRLTNEIYGIDVEKTVTVQPDMKITQDIKLDIPSQGTKPKY